MFRVYALGWRLEINIASLSSLNKQMCVHGELKPKPIMLIGFFLPETANWNENISIANQSV